MSHITRDINRVTGTVIGISGKLILYALVILLLAEGVTRGYAFGHSLFYESSVEQAPGRDIVVTVPDGQSDSDTIHELKKDGLIDNELAMRVQMKFYDYEIHPGTYTLNTSMSSKKMLQILVAATRPKRILEVGTAVGYSALLMAQVMPEETDIITIEKYEPRIPVARRHFAEAGLSDRITLLEGDAGEILKKLDGSFDFIFMDAAKGQYIHWLPDILRLLSTGGVLFSDNVLQDGDIIESRFAVERRNRTIHARMREYLYTLTHMPEFQTSVVPIGDGVALSVKG